MSSRLLPAALGLLGSLASAAFAALPSSGGDVLDLAHPAIRTFSDREGLPQNTVHAITRDGQGYLWVGTQDGAGRWNGRTWTTIDMPDRQVSNYVRAVLPARDGSVWFGREDGGVVRLLPGGSRPVPPPESFVVYDAAAGLPAPRVNQMLQTRDGEIWAATLGGGAARFAGDRFEAVSEGLTDLRLWALAEIEDDDGRRRLLAGGEGGLFVLDGRRWKRYEAAPEASQWFGHGKPLAAVARQQLVGEARIRHAAGGGGRVLEDGAAKTGRFAEAHATRHNGRE